MQRTLCTSDMQHNDNLNFVSFRKGMILLKWEEGFFPKREDLPLLEVTAKTGLWHHGGMMEEIQLG